MNGKNGPGAGAPELPPPISIRLTLHPGTGAFAFEAPPGVPRWVLYGILKTGEEVCLKQGLEDQLQQSRLVRPTL